MIKVKFVMSGQNDSFMKERIIRNFFHTGNQNDDFAITDLEDYDYIVICNRTSVQPRVPKKNIIGTLMEPSWSSNWDRNLPNICEHIFVHDNSLFGFSGPEIIERPSLMFTEFYDSPETVPYFFNNEFKKTKKICAIISGLNNNRVLYPLRIKLVNDLLKTNIPIDIYGRGWTPDGGRLKGGFIQKLNIIRDYEFSVAIENSSEKNYISEKFFDLPLTETVPLYYGCPNISKVYDPDSFIHLDLYNTESCIELIKSIASVDYESFIPSLRLMRYRYFYEHNLYSEVCRLIANKEGLTYKENFA